MHWSYNDPVCFQLDTAKSFHCVSFQLRWNKMSLNTDKSLGQADSLLRIAYLQSVLQLCIFFIEQ